MQPGGRRRLYPQHHVVSRGSEPGAGRQALRIEDPDQRLRAAPVAETAAAPHVSAQERPRPGRGAMERAEPTGPAAANLEFLRGVSASRRAPGRPMGPTPAESRLP